METDKSMSDGTPVMRVALSAVSWACLPEEDKARYYYNPTYGGYYLIPGTYTEPQPELPGIEATVAERGSRYGVFIEEARIGFAIKAAMKDSPNWQVLPDDGKLALENIAHKIARILNGDMLYLDNWHDIQGYANIVERRIQADLDALKAE